MRPWQSAAQRSTAQTQRTQQVPALGGGYLRLAVLRYAASTDGRALKNGNFKFKFKFKSKLKLKEGGSTISQ